MKTKKKKTKTASVPKPITHKISPPEFSISVEFGKKRLTRKALWALANGLIAGGMVYWQTHDYHLFVAVLWIVAMLTKN